MYLEKPEQFAISVNFIALSTSNFDMKKATVVEKKENENVMMF